VLCFGSHIICFISLLQHLCLRWNRWLFRFISFFFFFFSFFFQIRFEGSNLNFDSTDNNNALFVATGALASVAAGRIAYLFDLSGEGHYCFFLFFIFSIFCFIVLQHVTLQMLCIFSHFSYLFFSLCLAISVDTACSSSLVACSMSFRSLRNNDASRNDDADVRHSLCCGVNSVRSSLALFPILTHAKMLSSDGRCKTFDASANGYVFYYYYYCFSF
jgi:hypothetical protein